MSEADTEADTGPQPLEALVLTEADTVVRLDVVCCMPTVVVVLAVRVSPAPITKLSSLRRQYCSRVTIEPSRSRPQPTVTHCESVGISTLPAPGGEPMLLGAT